jgi:hypothetical protein
MSFISNTASKQPIEVGILEISAQNKAVLEFFFSGVGKSYFKEVSLDKASAYIIDYDSLGAKESWASIFEKTNKPGIIISIKEVNLPSTVWLQKPLTVKALKEAGGLIRETMFNEVVLEPVVTIIEEKIKEKAAVAGMVENIIEPQEEIVVQKITKKENSQVDELLTEEIINIPSRSISQIVPQEDILKVDDDDFIDLIEQTAEVSEESLLTVEVPKVKTDKIDSLISEKEQPELAMAGTKASASSSDFATSSNFIDIDPSLNSVDESTGQKSSTTPIDNPKTVNSNEGSEIDLLLESLISGGKSNQKADKLVDNITDDSSHLLDFDLDLGAVEAKTIKPEKEVSELADLTITDTKIIEDDGSTLELENNNLEDPNAELSDELITTIDSLETTETIDDKIINKILHKGNKVEKPQKTAEEELQSLLEEIRQEADGTKETIATSTSYKKGQSHIIKKYATTNAEERWKLICGDNNLVDLQKVHMFNPNNHVLATIIQNIRIAQQSQTVSRMKFSGIIVVIDPKTDRIYCDQTISTTYYANICYEPLARDKIKVHQLDQSEIRLYRKKMKEDAEHTHFTEAFIWTSSLLTSRGRLPKNTNIKTQLGLKTWPDLTRVENIPHMMKIAALFHKNTWSLLEITKKSDIQQNYVIAFYNAALALDMIETDGEAADSAPLNLKTSGNKNRSFLSRFLKKITA